MESVNIVWFRNGLRLHDNESLHHATKDTEAKLLPIFIFDGETPTTKKCKYNKFQFLLECLVDLNEQLDEAGGRLYCVRGSPTDVFRNLSKKLKIEKLCFDQDCEPIWLERDNSVKNFCGSHKIEVVESIGGTLWDPLEIIDANGGTPPLTFSQFCHVSSGLGPPRRPADDLDLKSVNFVDLSETLMTELNFLGQVPTAESMGFVKEDSPHTKVFKGGERRALKYFRRRLESENEAFLDGSFLPNRRDPDILCPPKSLSPDLKFGCLSVKTFYWAVQDAFDGVYEGNPPARTNTTIVSQLIWREFFYAMSANNPFYGEVKRNPICIHVPWHKDCQMLDIFLAGKTGFPFIDAGIRQLKGEGWIHHTVRNALSMFLTRGDLWLSWEHGLDLFLSYLIDADWAICAGNWMWVSSSAFEKALNSTFILDPRVYGRRVDPHGEYIKRYIPELKNFPCEYIYDPSSAPLDVQEKAGCIIGQDYPKAMLDHDKVSTYNKKMMQDLQESLLKKLREQPLHIKPSDDNEVKNFFRLGITDD